MTREQIGIVLDLLKRNVRPECRHEARHGEFVVFEREEDGLVRQMVVKERARTIVLYGSSCRAMRRLLEARRAELAEAGWNMAVPGLNTDRDVAVWCQIQGEGREDWFGQRELVVVAVMRLWRTLRAWGVLADDAAAFRACVEPYAADGESAT